MTDISKVDFDYGLVDAETASKLEYYAKSGKSLMRRTQIEFIAKMGEILSDARKLLASHNKKEGVFVKWAVSEFDVTSKTIYNYVNAWERILCNDYTRYLNWTQTALYLASADDFPKPIQKKLEKLPPTELVRTSDVKRLIEASKPKPKPAAENDPELNQPQVDVLVVDGEPDADEVEDDPTPVDAAAASPSIVLDHVGVVVPDKFRSANELAIHLNAAGREIDKYRQKAKEWSEQPGGEWLRLQDIDACIRELKGHFQSARYFTVCPSCDGKGGKCKKCDGAGWLPEYLKGTV